MNERSDNINYTMMIIENTPTRVYLFIEFLWETIDNEKNELIITFDSK